MGVTEVKSAAPDREKLRVLLSFARRVVVGLRDHGGLLLILDENLPVTEIFVSATPCPPAISRGWTCFCQKKR